MRIAAVAAALLLLAAAPATAQDVLPPELAARINRVLNDAATDRRDGDTNVAPGERVEGHLGVMDGDLDLAGEVEGDVVVVNGDLRLAPGARVGGEAIVVGGRLSGDAEGALGAGSRVFVDPVSHCSRSGVVDVSGRCAALAAGMPAEEEAWSDAAGPRAVRFLLSTGRSYNRVEGLPVRFGLGWTSAEATPLRVRVEGIYRTESGARLGPSRWGYAVEVERELGGAHGARVGARSLSLVDAIEGWHVSDLENSLATFLLRRDYRDHYERQGWSGYVALRPQGSPWDGTLSLARERHRSLRAGSPWTLVRNDLPWRPQPLVGEGHLVAATASLRIDTRSERRDPAAGWYLAAEVEQVLSSTLATVTWTALVTDPSGRFTRLGADLRRYNRISPTSRLNLRVTGGGALTERGLPPQRQFALGGEGTLPGYPLFEMDCGARAARVERIGGGGETYHPGYGCDRFLLAQVEYRSDLVARLPLPSADGTFAVRPVPLSWALFSNAATGWSAGARLPNERTALDVGAGVQWRELGAYVAVPVGARAAMGRANLFVRLSPRF
jgi:hypothetical protein